MSCLLSCSGKSQCGYQKDEIGVVKEPLDGGTANETVSLHDIHRGSGPISVVPRGSEQSRDAVSELCRTRSLWLMSAHGSAYLALRAPCTDKASIRRHEPCEHRRHELDGLDLLAMLLRKNFGV